MLLLLLFTVPARSEAAVVDLLVPPSVLADMPAFLAGDDLFAVRDFDRPNSRRDLVDYVLLRQALRLGSDAPLEVRVHPWVSISYDRVLVTLADGEATLLSNTLWREDVSPEHPDLYVSSATLEKGEYTAGLYMHPENPKLTEVTDAAQIRSLTAVSSRQFVPDWQALEQLGLAALYSEVNWENMVRMVHRQRVDFMLIPFSRQADLSQAVLDVVLKPLPGFKVALEGSRGWVVSRQHPAGASAFQALEKGLAVLKAEGIVARAYRESGVINARVDDWVLANKPLSTRP